MCPSVISSLFHAQLRVFLLVGRLRRAVAVGRVRPAARRVGLAATDVLRLGLTAHAVVRNVDRFYVRSRHFKHGLQEKRFLK